MCIAALRAIALLWDVVALGFRIAPCITVDFRRELLTTFLSSPVVRIVGMS